MPKVVEDIVRSILTILKFLYKLLYEFSVDEKEKAKRDIDNNLSEDSKKDNRIYKEVEKLNRLLKNEGLLTWSKKLKEDREDIVKKKTEKAINSMTEDLLTIFSHFAPYFREEELDRIRKRIISKSNELDEKRNEKRKEKKEPERRKELRRLHELAQDLLINEDAITEYINEQKDEALKKVICPSFFQYILGTELACKIDLSSWRRLLEGKKVDSGQIRLDGIQILGPNYPGKNVVANLNISILPRLKVPKFIKFIQEYEGQKSQKSQEGQRVNFSGSSEDENKHPLPQEVIPILNTLQDKLTRDKKTLRVLGIDDNRLNCLYTFSYAYFDLNDVDALYIPEEKINILTNKLKSIKGKRTKEKKTESEGEEKEEGAINKLQSKIEELNEKNIRKLIEDKIKELKKKTKSKSKQKTLDDKEEELKEEEIERLNQELKKLWDELSEKLRENENEMNIGDINKAIKVRNGDEDEGDISVEDIIKVIAWISGKGIDWVKKVFDNVFLKEEGRESESTNYYIRVPTPSKPYKFNGRKPCEFTDYLMAPIKYMEVKRGHLQRHAIGLAKKIKQLSAKLNYNNESPLDLSDPERHKLFRLKVLKNQYYNKYSNLRNSISEYLLRSFWLIVYITKPDYISYEKLNFQQGGQRGFLALIVQGMFDNINSFLNKALEWMRYIYEDYNFEKITVSASNTSKIAFRNNILRGYPPALCVVHRDISADYCFIPHIVEATAPTSSSDTGGGDSGEGGGEGGGEGYNIEFEIIVSHIEAAKNIAFKAVLEVWSLTYLGMQIKKTLLIFYEGDGEG